MGLCTGATIKTNAGGYIRRQTEHSTKRRESKRTSNGNIWRKLVVSCDDFSTLNKSRFLLMPPRTRLMFDRPMGQALGVFTWLPLVRPVPASRLARALQTTQSVRLVRSAPSVGCGSIAFSYHYAQDSQGYCLASCAI